MAGLLSKIDICNLAFGLLGADSIRDFSEHNKRARTADLLFDVTRDYVLSQMDWTFARRFVALNALADDDLVLPDSDMTAYQIPNDCLKVLEVYPRTVVQKYEIMEDKIITSIEDPYLKYTFRQLDEAKYSVTFCMAVALLLAVRMSPAITRDAKLTKELFGQYLATINEATQLDAMTGAEYRVYDEDPNNDPFVYPDVSGNTNATS